jgi:NAD(P)-dependent dehydrogenase (short-subunit alcohol dehydrogenase family)
MKGTFAVDLNGVVAVVTGASRGAGRAIALVLGEAGATVYVTRTQRSGQAVGTWALGNVGRDG